MARNNNHNSAMNDVEECSTGEMPAMTTDDDRVVKEMIDKTIEDAVTVNSTKDVEALEALEAAIQRVGFLLKENNWQSTQLEKDALKKLYDKLPSKVRFAPNKRGNFQTLSQLKEFVDKACSRANTVECVPSVATFVRRRIETTQQQHVQEDELEHQSWDLFLPKPEDGDQYYKSRQLSGRFAKNA